MITRRLLLASPAAFLVGCSTLQPQNLQTKILQTDGLKGYRRAFIEPVQEDEFHVVPALIVELADMGLEIAGAPFANPSETDLVVKVNAVGGWDMTRYLQSLQLQFVAAKSGRLVISSSFYSRGAWLGVRDGRLKSVFNDLREKNGFPPSKQFTQ